MKVTSAWIALAAAIVVAGCPNRQAQKNAQIQAELLSDETIPVTFATPRIESVEAAFEVSGPLRTLDDVTVGARVGGRLSYVSVQDGSAVRAGQVIAQVDGATLLYQVQQAQAAVAAAQSGLDQARIQARMSPEQSRAAVKVAEAGLASAKARLDLVRAGARSQEKEQAKQRVASAKSVMDKAKIDLDRARALYENGAIAKADVDNAQLQHDTSVAAYRQAIEAYEMILEGARPEEVRQAEEAVRQAEEQVRQAKANQMNDIVAAERVVQSSAQLRQAEAQLRQMRQALADTSVISPIDGYVSGIPAKAGQVVAAGSPVATIVGLHGVYFEAMVPETEIAKVKVGQSARISVEAYKDRRYDGAVIAIRPRADSLGRQFAVRIAVSNGIGQLRPGMFAQGTLVFDTIPNATLVPSDAVLRIGEKSFVFVANGSKAKRVEITVGLGKDSYVQVSGLSPSEKVIVGGKDKVTDGSTIREDKPDSGTSPTSNKGA